MEAFLTCAAMTLVMLLCVPYGQGSNISMNSEGIILPWNDRDNKKVSILCQSEPDPPGQLVSLTISRSHWLQQNSTLISIAHTNIDTNNGKAFVALFGMPSIPGAIVSGSVQEGEITLNLTQISCQDAGLYRCESQYSQSDSLIRRAQELRLAVLVLPGKVNMTSKYRFPFGVAHEINELELTCAGHVGLPLTDKGMLIEWMWTVRKNSSEEWEKYVPPTDISHEPFQRDPKDECLRLQKTKVKRRLSREDKGLTIRCHVQWTDVNRTVQSFEEFSQSHVIEERTRKGFNYKILMIVGVVMGGGITIGFVAMCTTRLRNKFDEKIISQSTEQISQTTGSASDDGYYSHW